MADTLALRMSQRLCMSRVATSGSVPLVYRLVLLSNMPRATVLQAGLRYYHLLRASPPAALRLWIMPEQFAPKYDADTDYVWRVVCFHTFSTLRPAGWIVSREWFDFDGRPSTYCLEIHYGDG